MNPGFGTRNAVHTFRTRCVSKNRIGIPTFVGALSQRVRNGSPCAPAIAYRANAVPYAKEIENRRFRGWNTIVARGTTVKNADNYTSRIGLPISRVTGSLVKKTRAHAPRREMEMHFTRHNSMHVA